MDPGKIFQIITNSTLLATRLLSGSGKSVLEFTQHRYCAVLREDTPTSSDVITVVANHKEGATVRYSIAEGNSDGLFTIDQTTGIITLAALLDYELFDKHELKISGEGGGQVVYTVVQVVVTDVNDNAPVFVNPNPHVTVIEEDDRHLPVTLIKVEAKDPDRSDEGRLHYTLRGDGVEGYAYDEAFFTINPQTGDIIQLKALDRDPPDGKRVWKLRVKVQDGQMTRKAGRKHPASTSGDQSWKEVDVAPSWSYEDDYQDDDPSSRIAGRDKNEERRMIQRDHKIPSKHKPRSLFWDGLKRGSTVSERLISDTAHPGMRDPGRHANWNAREKIRRRRWDYKEVRKLKKRRYSQISPEDRQRTGEMMRDYQHTGEKIREDTQAYTDHAEGYLDSKNRYSPKHIIDSSHQQETRQIQRMTYEVKEVKPNEESSVSVVGREEDRDRGEVRKEARLRPEFTNAIYQRGYVKQPKQQHKSSRIGWSEKPSNFKATDKGRVAPRRLQRQRVTPSEGEIGVPDKKKRIGNCKKKCQGFQPFSQEDVYIKRMQIRKGKKSRGSETKYQQTRSKEKFSKNLDYKNRNVLDDSEDRTSLKSMGDYANTEKSDVDQNTEEHIVHNGIKSWDDGPVKNTQKHEILNRKGEMRTISRESIVKQFTEDIHDRSPELVSHLGISRSASVHSSKGWKFQAIDRRGTKRNAELSRRKDRLHLNKLKRPKVDIHQQQKTQIKEFRFDKHPTDEIKFKSKGIKFHEFEREKKFESLKWGNGSVRPEVVFTNNERLIGHSSSSSQTSIKRSGTSRRVTGWLGELPQPHATQMKTLSSDRNSKSSQTLNAEDFEKSSITKNLHLPTPLSSMSSGTIAQHTGRSNVVANFSKSIPKSHVSTAFQTNLKFTQDETMRSFRGNDPANEKGDRLWNSHNISRSLKFDSNKTGRSRVSRDVNNEEIQNGFQEEEDDECPPTESLSSPGIEMGSVFTKGSGWKSSPVHEVEIVVTVVVKDINDNPPIFPNVTMFGEIKENGPAALSVTEVSAWDTDDATEGTNARITYFIEKNVIHDKSGEAIFSVHPQTGLVTTVLCCLDRETTPEYYIQVVASDGGGLRGTGTVVVRLTDENDNSPRLARKSWELLVDETWGSGPPDNITLLEMTAADPDAQNYFSYRVVEDSGSGWNYFGIRSTGGSGQLYALRTLDYENDIHRQGFRFMVQVTDRGEDGWSDPRHQDTAWVGVRLKDLNDNAPLFQRPNAHVTVKEDTSPGTLLISMEAHDPDMGGVGQVKYQVLGGWDALKVDEAGGVSLFRPLDRERDDGEVAVAKILASDQGDPSLTATATLSITVTDVNDCPPRLLPPTVLRVKEGEPPVLLGILTATDEDVWALGHGPPFSLSLAASNPKYIFDLIDLKFSQHMDSGRGGAEIWTRGALDREQHRQLEVEVVIVDAGGLNNTQVVTIIISDLNDNPMKPASKTVYLWKTQSSGSDAPLGRVYVEDPDDWDVADKRFHWVGKSHPLFTLNEGDGTIYASSQVREGRYDLQFSVSDLLWNQTGVSANVSVVVKMLTQEALTHAAPIILTPSTPTDLTRGWTPSRGGGGLGKLLTGVQDIIGDGSYQVEVVSVYGIDSAGPGSSRTSFVSLNTPAKERPTNHPPPFDNRFSGGHPIAEVIPATSHHPSQYACVWVSAKDEGGSFMDPVKLQGLLALHSKELEKITGARVLFKDPPAALGKSQLSATKDSPTLEESKVPAMSTLKQHAIVEGHDDSVSSMASTVLPLQVVDTNVTSLVTPLLLRAHECNTHERSRSDAHIYDLNSCTPASCLNGGKCVRFPTGNRCICPGGSWGPQCKILSRTFSGSGWAWLKPLPSCLPATISFRLLTRSSNALLLYSGPLVSTSETPLSMLTVQVANRWPQLLLEGVGRSIRIQVNTTVTDGEWHTVHVQLDSTGVALMVDVCGLGWEPDTADDSHCVARASWSASHGLQSWESVGPLQIGGLAQSPIRPEDYGWERRPIHHPLDGCLSHITINGQVVDLGEPAYSQGSVAGCEWQRSACEGGIDTCGIRGECVGGLKQPVCQCESGWSGPKCDTPTMPVTLGSKSFMKVALSFTPPSHMVMVQMRVRTLGSRTGMLLHLAAQHTHNSFTLHLRAGVACASVTGAGWVARVACVKGQPIGDGQWHTIRAERHGHNLLVTVDGGGEWRHNYSIPSLTTYIRGSFLQEITGPPMPLVIDKHDGVTIGGLPKFLGVKLVGIGEDLKETCVDDLRVSGHQLPLPPAVNGSSWGQVTTIDGLSQGCNAPTSCLNTSCEHPLSCHPTWMQAPCSCGPGRHLVGHRCDDVDECLLEPCLHSGSCYNLDPGYGCLCGPNHMGDHCEWTKVTSVAHPLTAPVVITTITFSLLVLVILGVFLSLRHRRLLRTSRELSRREGGAGDKAKDKDSVVISQEGDEEEEEKSKRFIVALDPERKGNPPGEKRCHLRGEGDEIKGPEDESHTSLLQLLKLSRTQPQQDVKGGGGGGGGASSGVSIAVITTAGGSSSSSSSNSRSKAAGGSVVVTSDPQSHHHHHHHHHLPGEDLRNYAYEGDGSSSGSLTSTISGLRAEFEREEGSRVVAKEFVEVMDLLKNLPDAPKSSMLLTKLKEKRASAAVVDAARAHEASAALSGSQRSLIHTRETKVSDFTTTMPSLSLTPSSSSSPSAETVRQGSLKAKHHKKDELTTTVC